MTTEATTTGDNSFISRIQSGFSSGVAKIGSDVLPNWAAKQISGESSDQLAQPTFDSSAPGAPSRLDNLFGAANGGGGKTVLIGGAVALFAIGGLFLALRK